MSKKTNGIDIRALCTDVDGTLLDSRRELSQETIDAIEKIKDSIPIILASSRMPSAMRHLQRTLGILQHPLICYNGGYILHYRENDKPAVLYSAVIPVNLVSAILEMSEKTLLHVSLYHADDWYAPKSDEWTLREATITKVSPHLKSGCDVIQDWKATGMGAHKIMIMGDASEISVMENELRRRFKDEIYVYHSKSTYLEIAPRVVTKASALCLVLEKLYNIPPANVIAFGDNYNDIEMLRSVGLGIAVENARDEVKAVAREITRDSKQNGVAHAIYKHLLGAQA